MLISRSICFWMDTTRVALHDSEFKIILICLKYWAVVQIFDVLVSLPFSQLSSDWLPLTNRRWGFSSTQRQHFQYITLWESASLTSLFETLAMFSMSVYETLRKCRIGPLYNPFLKYTTFSALYFLNKARKNMLGWSMSEREIKPLLQFYTRQTSDLCVPTWNKLSPWLAKGWLK